MRRTFLALGVTTALMAASQAQAVSVITFDDVPEGTVAAAQFSGVVFTGASVLTQGSQLNPPFPPFTQPNVAYDYLNGTITLNFTTLVDSIGAYVTGNTNITLQAFNGATLLGSVSTGNANYTGAGTGLDPNIFLSLAFPTITSAVFSNGTTFGNTFTLDNITIGGEIINNSAIPEPATWAMLIVGFGAVGATMRITGRRRRELASA